MEHIEETLREYPFLSAEERAAAEAYVAAHPEWEPLLEEGRTLARLFAEAQAFAAAPISDEGLVHYITTRAFSPPPPPPAIQAWFERIEQAMAEDATLRARYEALQQQFDVLDAWGTPEHFERVTGRRLPESAPKSNGEKNLLQGAVEPGYQRLAEPSRMYVLRPWLIAAAMVLVAVYGLLFWAGSAFQPPTARLARLTTAETHWSPPNVRGEPAARESAHLIEEAIAVYANARVSTLGLFPRYDRERLQQAEVLLQQALAQEVARMDTTGVPDTLLGLEALYFNGKVNLALRDVSEARVSFQQVVERQGPHAAAAARLLDAMRAETQ